MGIGGGPGQQPCNVNHRLFSMLSEEQDLLEVAMLCLKDGQVEGLERPIDSRYRNVTTHYLHFRRAS